MHESEVLRMLSNRGALITGSHIVYTSGRHGSAYVNKDAIFPYATEMSTLCWSIATEFVGNNIEVVVAPAIGGVVLSQWVGYHLTMLGDCDALAIYAESEPCPDDALGDLVPKRFVLKRGYDKLIPGKRVLVVEDILTTGGSAKGVVEATRLLGGEVVGLGALVNRGDITAESIGVPKLVALANLPLESWDAATCPLCKKGVPVNTDVGKGRESLAHRNLRC